MKMKKMLHYRLMRVIIVSVIDAIIFQSKFLFA